MKAMMTVTTLYQPQHAQHDRNMANVAANMASCWADALPQHRNIDFGRFLSEMACCTLININVCICVGILYQAYKNHVAMLRSLFSRLTLGNTPQHFNVAAVLRMLRLDYLCHKLVA
jgi:hypothetical protein